MFEKCCDCDCGVQITLVTEDVEEDTNDDEGILPPASRVLPEVDSDIYVFSSSYSSRAFVNSEDGCKQPETYDLSKNDERFAEFETKVGDNFGEEYGLEGVVMECDRGCADQINLITEDDWREFHSSDVWKNISEDVTEYEDVAMDSVSFDNAKRTVLAAHVQTKALPHKLFESDRELI